jgi:hypothetical protein
MYYNVLGSSPGINCFMTAIIFVEDEPEDVPQAGAALFGAEQQEDE